MCGGYISEGGFSSDSSFGGGDDDDTFWRRRARAAPASAGRDIQQGTPAPVSQAVHEAGDVQMDDGTGPAVGAADVAGMPSPAVLQRHSTGSEGQPQAKPPPHAVPAHV